MEVIFIASAVLVANAVVILYIYFLERKRNSITQLIWPVVAIFFVIPCAFHLAFDPYINSEINMVTRALLYALAFNAAYLVSFSIFFSVRSIPDFVEAEASTLGRVQQIQIWLAIGLIFGLLAAKEVGLASALESTWTQRSDLGLASVFIIWTFCFLAGKLCLAVHSRNYIVSGIIVTAFITIALLFRTRDLVGVLALSIMLYLVLVRRGGGAKTLVAIAAVGALSAISLRAVRLLGSLEAGLNFSAFKDMFEQVWRDIFITGDLSVYRIYFQVVDGCDKGMLCFEGTIGRHILSVVGVAERPTVRFEYYLYDIIYKMGVGGSLHPTAYGIAYGEYAVLGGCIFFAGFAAFNSFLSRVAGGEAFFLIVGFVAHYSIFFARGSVYNGLSVAVIGVALVIVSRSIVSLRGMRPISLA